MISKALLNSNAEAIDLCEHLTSWDIPARLTVNASGNPSRYVILDSANLTTEQKLRLARLHDLMWCRIDLHDIKLIEEL
jgi:hypothetical protein